MVTELIMEPFRTCLKLQELGFPQIRRDDSWYFIRPDMLIPLTEVNVIYGTDRRPYGYDGARSLFNELVYYPSLEELNIIVKPTQLVHSVKSGWMAYIDEPDQETQGITSKIGRGDTQWTALADLYIKYHPDNQK